MGLSIVTTSDIYAECERLFYTKAAHSALLDAVHAVSDDTDKRVVIKRLMRLCAAHRRSELMEKLKMMKPRGLGGSWEEPGMSSSQWCHNGSGNALCLQ